MLSVMTQKNIFNQMCQLFVVLLEFCKITSKNVFIERPINSQILSLNDEAEGVSILTIIFVYIINASTYVSSDFFGKTFFAMKFLFLL